MVQANENVKRTSNSQLGDVKTTVSVTEAVSQIETRTATIKEMVDQARVVELPLDGRNPADLALLVPENVAREQHDSTETLPTHQSFEGKNHFRFAGSRNINTRSSLRRRGKYGQPRSTSMPRSPSRTRWKSFPCKPAI